MDLGNIVGKLDLDAIKGFDLKGLLEKAGVDSLDDLKKLDKDKVKSLIAENTPFGSLDELLNAVKGFKKG